MTVTVEYRAQGETTFTQVARSEPIEGSRHGANDPIPYILSPDSQGNPVNPTWGDPKEKYTSKLKSHTTDPYGVVHLHYGLPNPSFVYVTTRTP